MCISNMPATTMPNDLPIMLKADQAASLLNVCGKQIRDLCQEKKIKAVKVGGAWRIPRDAFFAQFGLCDD